MEQNVQFTIPPRALAAVLARAALRVHPLVAPSATRVANPPDAAIINRSWFDLVSPAIGRNGSLAMIASVVSSQGASVTVQDAIGNAFAVASPLSNRPSHSRLPVARTTAHETYDDLQYDAALLILLCDCLMSSDHLLLFYENVLSLLTTLTSRIAATASCAEIATSFLNDKSALDTLNAVSLPALGSPIHPLVHPLWPALWPEEPPAWFSQESCDALFRQHCSSIPPHQPDNPHVGRGSMNLMDMFGC